jgi:hypothetical protein
MFTGMFTIALSSRAVALCARAYVNHDIQLPCPQPNDPSTLYNYAIFLEERKGDHVTAEEMYKRSLELDPTDVDALNNYGLLLQVHMCVYICMYVCICIYIYIYIYICTHTHTHAHIHTHMHACMHTYIESFVMFSFAGCQDRSFV